MRLAYCSFLFYVYYHAVQCTFNEYVCYEYVISLFLLYFYYNLTPADSVIQKEKLLVEKIQQVRQCIHDQLEDGISPSVTCDLWTSKTQDSFISFTVHLINKQLHMVTKWLGAIPFTGKRSSLLIVHIVSIFVLLVHQ